MEDGVCGEEYEEAEDAEDDSGLEGSSSGTGVRRRWFRVECEGTWG